MKLDAIVLDSDDIEKLSDFYAKMLGWKKKTQVINGEKWITVANSDYTETPLVFQEVLDYVRPRWPSKEAEQQQMLHLDFCVAMDEFERTVEHAVSCGASIAETQFSNNLKVMIDVAGHPFCIIPLPNDVYARRYGK